MASIYFSARRGGHVSNPYKYPDGIWGIKVDGKQVLTVRRQHLTSAFVYLTKSQNPKQKTCSCCCGIVAVVDTRSNNSEVGGKYRDIEKCHEIACVAAAELRKGTKLEDVRSMVVALQQWTFSLQRRQQRAIDGQTL